jgi:DNA-directed RNA polymerase specialized sigma24 family protein
MTNAISIENAEAWIPQWHPSLFRLARAVVYSDHEATSVVYAAYLKLLGQLPAGAGPKDLAHDLQNFVFLGAMRERVLLRGQMLRLLDAAADADPSVESGIDDVSDAQFDGRPAQLVESERPGDAIADGLSDMLRVVFVMIDVIGMTVPEAARLLHIQEATVESRVQRARVLVMDLLKKLCIRELPEIYAVSEAQCRAAVAHVRERVASATHRIHVSV